MTIVNAVMFNEEKKNSFLSGARNALPIFWGYLAVAFSIGITAAANGITWYQAGLMSITNHTSAGEAAAVMMIGSGDSYFNVGLTQLVFNMRYILMSTALALRLREDTTLGERLLMSASVTDEIFGISVMRKSPINAWFSIGALAVASPGWVLGTILGALMGDVLPASVVSALSVVLYSMFICVVVPPCKKEPFMWIVVISSMLISAVFDFVPFLAKLGFGTKAILLTILIASFFALVRPVEEKEEEGV